MCKSNECPHGGDCPDCGGYVCQPCFRAVLAKELVRWSGVIERLKDH